MINAIYIILGYFILFFIVATIIKNNSIVDIGWGLGFVITVWTLFFISQDFTVTKIIMNIMVSIWGLRLFYHILKRNLFDAEDFRYAAWRKAWGKWIIPRAFLQVFMLQGLFMFVVGYPAFYINTKSETMTVVSYIGIMLYLIGMFFETVGDKQLRDFIKDKSKSGLLTTGLWKYTRHPNYFGESVIWWGVFLFAVGSGAPIVVVFSPVIITFLLRFVSGVPMLEAKMSQKEGWDDYAKKTNAFIPWVSK